MDYMPNDNIIFGSFLSIIGQAMIEFDMNYYDALDHLIRKEPDTTFTLYVNKIINDCQYDISAINLEDMKHIFER